jgi:DNA-binding transcriptional regulator YhcF (GntR family)
VIILVIWGYEKFTINKDGIAAQKKELNKVITKVYATIEHLQQLALALAEPIVINITMQNRNTHFVQRSSLIEYINKIVKGLEKIGIPEDEIKKVTAEFTTQADLIEK